MSWCYIEPVKDQEKPYKRGGINLYPAGLETIVQYAVRQGWGAGSHFLANLHAGVVNSSRVLLKAFPIPAEGNQKVRTTLSCEDIHVSSIPASAEGFSIIAIFTIKDPRWNEVFTGEKLRERETTVGTKVLWSEVQLPWMTEAGMREYEVY